MKNNVKHCIWLTFESALLDSIIFELSEKYNTPIYQPHCTIIGRTTISLVQLKAALVSVVGGTKIQNIRVGDIGYRDDYFMSYYLEILDNQFVTDLHKNLTAILDLEERADYLPHISLMYSSMQYSEKHNIKIPINKGDVIKAKSLQITDCTENIENWKPVFELLLI